MDLFERRRAPFFFLALGVAGFVVASAFVGVLAASATTTSSVLTAVKAALKTQTGVHLVISSKSGYSSTSVVADLGTQSGSEKYSSGKVTISIEVTRTDAYVSGSSEGLMSFLGLSASQAKKVGSDWIAAQAGTSEYSKLKPGTTISAVAGLLPKAKGTTLSSEITNGTKLYVLKWTTPATATLPKALNTFAVSAVGTPLPVEETVTGPSGSGTTHFSKWGEHVVIATPPAASTVAYSKVMG